MYLSVSLGQTNIKNVAAAKFEGQLYGLRSARPYSQLESDRGWTMRRSN